MSEDGKDLPRINRRSLGKIAAGAAAVFGLGVFGLKVHEEFNQSPNLQKENDPELLELLKIDRDILNTIPPDNIDELQNLYSLSINRRSQMSAIMNQYPDKAREFIRGELNTRARDKLKALLLKNREKLEQGIFNRPGQADKVEWLWEEEINQLIGGLRKTSEDKRFGFYPDTDTRYELVTNQNFSVSTEPGNPGTRVRIEKGIKLQTKILADPDSIKPV